MPEDRDDPLHVARREARVVVRSVRLEDDVPPRQTTPEQRLEALRDLIRDGWALLGREMPAYAVGEAPGRLVRRDVERA
ncbi:MAG: hypothetical protein H6732_06675 [Alphaproteobacteria bacterium]|nr:hypothetical protein [Alphaproteobacteria bacterium]